MFIVSCFPSSFFFHLNVSICLPQRGSSLFNIRRLGIVFLYIHPLCNPSIMEKKPNCYHAVILLKQASHFPATIYRSTNRIHISLIPPDSSRFICVWSSRSTSTEITLKCTHLSCNITDTSSKLQLKKRERERIRQMSLKVTNLAPSFLAVSTFVRYCTLSFILVDFIRNIR